MSTRKRGHSAATRRVPADGALPAREYVTLCQCGWTDTAFLRVLADQHRAQHVARAYEFTILPPLPWVCPCGTGFNTRKDREAHLTFCDKAPEGWTA